MKPLDLNLLSISGRREAVCNAKDALPAVEQAQIDASVYALIYAIKSKSPHSPFSYDNALEVLAAIGMLMRRRTQ